ncbi:MAG: tape measure protein [Verrucomicrobiota bacterium]
MRGAFSEITRLGNDIDRATSGKGGAFKGQISGAKNAGRSFRAAGQAAAAAGGQMTQTRSRASQLFRVLTTAGKAGEAIGGISLGVRTLSRWFGRLKAKSAPALQSVTKGTKQTAQASNMAAASSKKFYGRLAKGAAIAGTAAVAIWGVHKAWKALSSVRQPNLKLPKMPRGGGGGGLKGLLPGFALGAGAVALGAGLFGSIKKTVGDALQKAAAEEQLQISFEVLAGGLAPAKKALGEIRTLSENTPLRFVDLAGAGRKLLAFQEDAGKLPATLKRIGDISSGIQAPIGEIAEIFGKARVQGTLFAEDINQLTGRGIPVLTEFASILGTTPDKIKKMASEGQITFPLLERAFQNLTSEGGIFYKMMERQSRTVAGLWSTLKDRISGALTQFGKPINDALRPLLKQAVELVGKLKEKAANFGNVIAGAIDKIRAAFQVLSGGELFSLIGKGLELAFKTAVDFLVRAMSAVVKSLQNAEFMTGLGEKIRGMGVMLKDILLSAVEASLRALGGITGVGLQFNTAATEVNSQRLRDKFSEDDRRNRLREAGVKDVDLGKVIKDNFNSSKGIFGNDRKELLASLESIMIPVIEQAKRNRDNREKKEDSTRPDAKRDGLIPTGGASGGAGVVGAFQRAVNLVQGKTINEQIAKEATFTNGLLKDMKKTAEDSKRAIDIIVENTRDGNDVTIEVVPIFGEGLA